LVIWLSGYLVIWKLAGVLRLASYYQGAAYMSEQSEALKERTMSFAINVLKLLDKFPRTVGAEAIGRQLAKAAPSVGANYRASCNARSRAEFIARLGVVVEESDESVFWLEIVRRMRIVDTPEVPSLLQEASSFARSLGGLLARLESTCVRSVALRPMPK
jgi:four helix bundle protein